MPETIIAPLKDGERAFPSEVTALFLALDEAETRKTMESLPKYLNTITQALRLIARTVDLKTAVQLRKDPHFVNLQISSISSISNFSDRQLHTKIINYLAQSGVDVGHREDEIKKYFQEKDREKRQEILDSYSAHGLLTLRSLIQQGIVSETSSTPGDADPDDLAAADELRGDIRGYVLEESFDPNLLYGRNSFFKVVLEKGDESIDRASQLEKSEVENRARNSVLFVVKKSVVESAKVDDPHITSEDIIGRDILPAEVPNYEQALRDIIQREGPVWCHIARLPADTYPE
jgi:hypothetical protein